MANRNERKYRFYGTLIYWILRLISVTTKLHVYREKNYNQKEAYIYAGWHQKIFLPVLSLTEVEKKAVVVIFEVIPSQQSAIIRYYIGV